MAIKIQGTTVISDSATLTNIVGLDQSTIDAFSAAGIGGGGTDSASTLKLINEQTTVYETSVRIGKDALALDSASNLDSAAVAIGYRAGANSTSNSDAVLIGYKAGSEVVCSNSVVSIGYEAGKFGCRALFGNGGDVNIGRQAGMCSDWLAVNIGRYAGCLNGGVANVNIGNSAGAEATSTSSCSVNIGTRAGRYSSSSAGVNIGRSAGLYSSSSAGVNIGDAAGCCDNRCCVINIGYGAGCAASTSSNYHTINIGYLAGQNSNCAQQINIGYAAGCFNSGFNAINIGTCSGSNQTCNLAQSNISIGLSAGRYLCCGYNVAIGYLAHTQGGFSNYNVAIGTQAGYFNNGALQNVFVGNCAGYGNSTGDYNVAVGAGALYDGNGLSTANTAIGYQAGYYNEGDYNVFAGYQAGYHVSGISCQSYSISIGYRAGYFQRYNPSYNINIGYQAGYYNGSCGINTASNNIYFGYRAGYLDYRGCHNTFIGYLAGCTGNGTTTRCNVIAIGCNAQPSTATVSNQITFGNASITSIRAAVTTITAISDERDKCDIRDIPYGTDFIKAMRPVEFTWNTRDNTKVDIPDVGFIAQDLQSVEEQFNSTNRTRLTLLSEVYQDSDQTFERLEASPERTYPILVKAVQELINRVETIESKIDNI